MRAALPLILTCALTLGACGSPGGPYPSLAPRPAEAIDPRVPVERPINNRPVTPALASRLAEIVAEARRGDAAFASIAAEAERLAAAAGPAHGDGWTAAQQALSAAIAARAPTATALGDIDAVGANALQTQSGIAPNDLAAFKRAEAEIAALDQRQADRIKALQQRLGS
jgi:hypothetical protein